MALRPGDGIAHEAFVHARAQSRGRVVDPFMSTIVHRVGNLLVATDLRYRLLALAVAAGTEEDSKILVAVVGADEWGDYKRVQNRKPYQRTKHMRRKRQRARA